MNAVSDRKPIRRGASTGKEKIHECLEREGRPEATPMMDWIEHWYDQLPSDKQRDIRGRMRFGDQHRFASAYFELQMFAVRKRMVYHITVEPRLADARYDPDFPARCDDEAFYLEAPVCGQGAGALEGTRDEYDAVGEIRAAFGDQKVELHSDLWLQAEGVLNRSPSKKDMSRAFIDLMRRTDAAEVRESFASDSDHHRYRTEYQG